MTYPEKSPVKYLYTMHRIGLDLPYTLCILEGNPEVQIVCSLVFLKITVIYLFLIAGLFLLFACVFVHLFVGFFKEC